MIPLHLITGHLGAGKTTLIQHFLRQKPAQAGDWLVLVNEFSALGVDGKILAAEIQGQDRLLEVAGGCICCTSKLLLQQTLLTALRQQRFSRIFVEPTGLGLPQSLVDLFLGAEFAEVLQLATIFCVLDAQWPQLLAQWPDLQERLTLADVIVINKKSLATAEVLEKIAAQLAVLYPPKPIIYTDFSAVALTYLHRPSPSLPSPSASTADFIPLSFETNAKKTDFIPLPKVHLSTLQVNALPFIPMPWTGVQRLYQTTETAVSLSWQWPETYQFSLTALRQWQQQVAAYPGLQRVKGIFRLGQSYRLLQWAGRWQEDFIIYRRESLLEIIADNQAPWATWEQQLRQCLYN